MLEVIQADMDVTLDSLAAGPKSTQSLQARQSMLTSPLVQRALLGGLAFSNLSAQDSDFEKKLESCGWNGLYVSDLEIFQINLGKLCNMTCQHCHVDAGPDRTDAMMSRETVDACLRALDQTQAHTVDLTGGAPELHPDFCYLIDEARKRGKHVIDRCNLTILLVKKYQKLPQWFAEREVEVVASLPHYRKLNTDAQRGDGTFEKSIAAMKRLNSAGYGQGDPKRRLSLMSNPAGAYLAGDQAKMEREWKEGLQRNHGVSFDRLITLNNMPISRFLEWLQASENLQSYMERLLTNFNPAAVSGLMCRNTISISWDGRIYDCDFNQMLDIGAELSGSSTNIRDFKVDAFLSRRIKTERHCFGCTAGSGSSCGGATVAKS